MPGKRSDPTKYARERAQDPDYSSGYDAAVRQYRIAKVKRSQAAAQKSAEEFKQTGEGTLAEAFQHMREENADRQYVKKYGGGPTVSGGAVIGFRKNRNPI